MDEERNLYWEGKKAELLRELRERGGEGWAERVAKYLRCMVCGRPLSWREAVVFYDPNIRRWGRVWRPALVLADGECKPEGSYYCASGAWYADWQERPMEYLFQVGLAVLSDTYRAEDCRRFAALVAALIAEFYPDAALPRLRQQSYKDAEELMAGSKQPRPRPV